MKSRQKLLLHRALPAKILSSVFNLLEILYFAMAIFFGLVSI